MPEDPIEGTTRIENGQNQAFISGGWRNVPNPGQQQTGQNVVPSTGTPPAGSSNPPAGDTPPPSTNETTSSTSGTTTTNDNRSRITQALNNGSANINDLMTATGLTADQINQELANDYTLNSQFRLNDINNQQDAAFQKQQADLTALNNGTFALSPEEQSQITNLQNLYANLRTQQLTANKNYEGAVTLGNIRTGQQEFLMADAAGNFQQAVSDGIKKISELDTKASQAVTDLKQAFKDKNYKQITANYEATNKYLKEKSDAIKEIYNNAKAAYDAEQKAQQQEIDNQFKYAEFDMKKMDQALAEYKFDYTQKQDAIQNMLANDKFTWQQKQDLLKNELDRNKFSFDQTKDQRDYALKLNQYKIDLAKASASDTPENYKEWQLSGGLNSGKTYDEFLLNKGKTTEKPATADQQKNAGYALRVKDADNTIKLFTKSFIDLGYIKGSAVSSKWYPNNLKSADQQRFERAQIDFVNAVLRGESGAAIAISEFTTAEKQYFPQPGDTAQVIKDKERARRNKLNGLIMSSGNALSEDFKNNIDKVSYPDLQTYIDLNTDKEAQINEIRTTYPNWSPDEVLQFIQDSEDFSSVGGDTNSATLNKVVSKQDNTKGGQCGRFVNQIAGIGVGDSFQSKMNKMDPTITTPEPGMIFTMPYKNTGHTGFIVAINNDGTATVKDSNYYLDGKIKTHKIPISKMTGFRMV